MSTSEPPIDEALVRSIAFLARLEIPDDRIPLLAREFAQIHELVSVVQTIQVEPGMDSSSQEPVDLDALRADDAGPTLDRAAIVRNAPAHDGAFFVVPRFFEES